MGGVSWEVHEKLKDENDHHIHERDELKRQYEEMKAIYEKRQQEYQAEKEAKEREFNDLKNKKQLAVENLNNALQKIQDEEILLIEKEIESQANYWCKEEIKEIDFDKIITDCFKEIISSENINNSIKENIK